MKSDQFKLFSIFSGFLSCFQSEGELFFLKTKGLLEEYEKKLPSAHLIKSIERQSSENWVVLPKTLSLPIDAYVNYLFLLAHSSLNLTKRPEISDNYFDLLEKIQDFLLSFCEKSLEKSTTEMTHVKETILKIALTFYLRGKNFTEIDDSFQKKRYENLTYKCFTRLFSKNFSSYEKFIYCVYKKYSEKTNHDFLKKVFNELSQAAVLAEKTTTSMQTDFFSPLHVQQKAEEEAALLGEKNKLD